MNPFTSDGSTYRTTDTADGIILQVQSSTSGRWARVWDKEVAASALQDAGEDAPVSEHTPAIYAPGWNSLLIATDAAHDAGRGWIAAKCIDLLYVAFDTPIAPRAVSPADGGDLAPVGPPDTSAAICG